MSTLNFKRIDSREKTTEMYDKRRAYRKRRREEGNCIVCGKPAEPSDQKGPTTGTSSFCLKHLISAREQQKRNITPEYRAYQAAKSRCLNPKATSYEFYGGRGIEFRFTSYEQFLETLGRRPSPNHSVDRIDVNGHYEPGNVRWATTQQQRRNTRQVRRITAFGETLIVAEWTERLGFSKGRIFQRLRIGWCDECAVSHRSTCLHRPDGRRQKFYLGRVTFEVIREVA